MRYFSVQPARLSRKRRYIYPLSPIMLRLMLIEARFR